MQIKTNASQNDAGKSCKRDEMHACATCRVADLWLATFSEAVNIRVIFLRFVVGASVPCLPLRFAALDLGGMIPVPWAAKDTRSNREERMPFECLPALFQS